MLLVQADGKLDLEIPEDWNEGDAGDPFPGSKKKQQLKDTGTISTSFPGSLRSGVSLDNIRLNPDNGVITLDVKFSSSAPTPAKKRQPVKKAVKPNVRRSKAIGRK